MKIPMILAVLLAAVSMADGQIGYPRQGPGAAMTAAPPVAQPAPQQNRGGGRKIEHQPRPQPTMAGSPNRFNNVKPWPVRRVNPDRSVNVQPGATTGGQGLRNIRRPGAGAGNQRTGNKQTPDVAPGEGGGKHGGGQGSGGKSRHDPPQISFQQALQHCQNKQRHDKQWWQSHYTTIVFVNTGYYYFFSGYWFPAYGYDPSYDTYSYDGPIYTYGNLLPDQVIYNVQRALQELGYYQGNLSGSLGPQTREAIAAFQNDNGLVATGAIDADTVEALGLLGND